MTARLAPSGFVSAIAAVVILFGAVACSGDGAALEEAEAQKAELIAEVAELREEGKQAAAEGQRLRVANESLGEKNEGLARRLEQLEADLETQSGQLEKARDELAVDVDRFTSRIAQLEDELQLAEERAALADGFEEQLAALERQSRTTDAVEPVDDDSEVLSEAAACGTGQIDVNSASESQLQQIHQVGPDRAAQIVALRPFSSLDDLRRVSGIGDAHLSAIKGQGLACVP